MLKSPYSLPRLLFISAGETLHAQLNGIKTALDAGVQFLQIRWKEAEVAQLQELIERCLPLWQEYQAICSINDHPELAKLPGVQGLHLGLTDMPIAQARELIGEPKIIGGTANSLADVQHRQTEACDYIGLGPMRFTHSKKNLSPILGLQGYAQIQAALAGQQVPPIYAIGGILLDDVLPLRSLGIHGVAVSGLILQQPSSVKQLNERLHEQLDYSK